jgi:hypothetical protein
MANGPALSTTANRAQTPVNGHATLARVVITVCTTLAGAGVIALCAYLFELAGWRGTVDADLASIESMHSKVDTALVVIADHGTEFAHLRNEVQVLRGELLATRTELLEAVRGGTDDRFTGTDWVREREIIHLRIGSLEEQVSRVLDKLESQSKND